MIVLAIIHISESKSNVTQPPIADISGVPNLFGVSVYSFMCQHSLPSLVTPIKNKRGLSKLLAADYALILVFYMLLGLTAIYCFSSDVLKDIYTLNFQVKFAFYIAVKDLKLSRGSLYASSDIGICRKKTSKCIGSLDWLIKIK